MATRTMTRTGAKRTGRRATARKSASTDRNTRKTPENVRGETRVCEAPGCGKRYPAYVARQRFCSPVCRARAFYWDFKDEHGERYGARYERAARKRSGSGRAGRSGATRSRAGAGGSTRRATSTSRSRSGGAARRTSSGGRSSARRAGTRSSSRRAR